MSQSEEGPANTDEDFEIETEHPIERFIDDHLGPVALLFEPENMHRIRRGIEVLLVAVLAIGMVYWAFLITTQGF